MPQRATKIVATLGPASSDPALLEAMIRAGVNVVRLNFSHGDPSGQAKRAAAVRLAAQRVGAEVGILADLPGPKIRVERFAEGKVVLKTGELVAPPQPTRRRAVPATAAAASDAADLADQRVTSDLGLGGEALQRLDLPPLHDHGLEDLVVHRVAGLVEAVPDGDRDTEEALTRDEPVTVVPLDPVLVAHLHVSGMPDDLATALEQLIAQKRG